MGIEQIRVEVAYATPLRQQIVTLTVSVGSTIEAVIKQSGIMKLFSEIDLTRHKVGIFSKVKQLTDLVHANDRIEIYRELTMDPKEARRKRALT